MHDPLTVAFEIKYPWFKYKPWPKGYRHSRDKKWDWQHKLTEAQREGRDPFWDEGYRETFITIWHKDPCRGGHGDDSCGFSYPHLTNWQKERLWNAAWGEGQNPHFLCVNGKEWDGTYTEAVSLYLGMVLIVVRVLNIRVSFDYCQRIAVERIHFSDCCATTNVFCFLPGYHTNNEKDSEKDRQEHFHGILCGIARSILRDRRPWWKHPRWHFWHWRIQVPFWQWLKRGLFDRCALCHKGFKFGESCMGNWAGTAVWHEGCDHVNRKESPLPTCQK